MTSSTALIGQMPDLNLSGGTMVCTCVAAGCYNTHRDGVSLFQFPKDSALREKWAEQVKRYREDWEPTRHSVLCSEHFDDSCFEMAARLMPSFGLGKTKRSLKPGAVPTLFSRPLKRKGKGPKPQARKRGKTAAYDEHRHLEVRINENHVYQCVHTVTGCRIMQE